tara:strand:+ start:898 stop:2136 length:1239 start_codon:yes stop_codon:yes gene_type:complete
MATITTTTTTTTTEDLPVDQQSIVITSSRNLDTLLLIQNEVSQEEADEISEIQLYNLIEPNKNSTIVTLDNENNKKWIVIDWVTGHLNDLRLGFRDQGGLTPKPNVIRQQLMQQQYGSGSSSSDRKSTSTEWIDFQGENSDLDMQETLMKHFIKQEPLTISDQATGEERKTNLDDFFEALQEVMKFHLNKIDKNTYAGRQNLRLYRALLTCFFNPKLYTNKIEPLKNEMVEIGMHINFTDKSKIVKEVLIYQTKTKKGDGLWSIQILHNLGLGYDPNVLNLYFVIMCLDHYNENDNNITEALNNCYKDNNGTLKLDVIRLESGFSFESDALSGQLDQMATKKAGKKRGKFSRKELKDKLLAELIGNYNNNNNNNNSKKKKKKKKKKKRRKPNPETGSSTDPIDLTLLKALKF